MKEFVPAKRNTHYVSVNPNHDFGLIPIYAGGRNIGISDGNTYEIVKVEKDATTLKSLETGSEVKVSSHQLVAKGFAPILEDGSHANGVRALSTKAFCNTMGIPYLGENR